MQKLSWRDQTNEYYLLQLNETRTRKRKLQLSCKTLGHHCSKQLHLKGSLKKNYRGQLRTKLILITYKDLVVKYLDIK